MRSITVAMTTADGLPLPQRTWAIVAIGLGVTLAVIDSAIANVALPTIAADLHTDPAFSIWIVNGYQLAITISLLPLSSLGDIMWIPPGLSRRPDPLHRCLAWLRLRDQPASAGVGARDQGFGAAGIMSVNTALLRFIYPQKMLGRGIGINALVVAVKASAIGPTIAGAILAIANWPWLFAVNVPIGIAAVAVGFVFAAAHQTVAARVRYRQCRFECGDLRPSDRQHRPRSVTARVSRCSSLKSRRHDCARLFPCAAAALLWSRRCCPSIF